jgi:phosphoenolpyruvate-protein kinase (PTS system EI component)
VDEFLAARDLVRTCQQELAREGVPSRIPDLGMMIELPSAVPMMPEWRRRRIS